MSLSQRAAVDEEIEAGKETGLGVPPTLTPLAAYYVQLWSILRSATPGDQPISLQSICLLIGRGQMIAVLPLIQGMDRVLFECVRDRREAERKRAEEKARRGRQSGGRR